MLLICKVEFIAIAKVFGPAMLSALVTYFMFHLSTDRDKKKKRKELKKAQLNRVRFIIYKLEDCIKSTDAQIIAYRNHIGDSLANPYLFTPIPQFIDYDLARIIENLEDETAFIAFTELKALKRLEEPSRFYANLITRLDFIKVSLTDLMNTSKSRFEYIKQTIHSIQVETDATRACTSNLMIRLQQNETRTEVDEHYISTMKSFYNDLSKKEQTIEVYHENYVNALAPILASYMHKNFSEVSYLIEAVRSRDISDRLYSELIESTEGYAKELEEATDKLETQLNKVKEMYSNLKNVVNDFNAKSHS